MLQPIKDFFKGKAGKNLPFSPKALPVGGKSSVDPNFIKSLDGVLTHYHGLQPNYSPDIIPALRFLAVFHADVSKAVSMIQALANTGHKIIVDEKSATRAITELNGFAANMYKSGMGADGWLNHDIRENSITGVGSSEVEILPDFSGVKQPLIIPGEEIRFMYVDSELKPFQVTTGNIEPVELNGLTYKYYPLERDGRSPYAIPPLAASIEPANIQINITDDMREIVRKLSLFGLTFLEIDPPGEVLQMDVTEQGDHYQKYIEKVLRKIEEAAKDGLIGLPRGIKATHNTLANAATGLKTITEQVGRLLFTGLKSDAGFHGISVNRAEMFLAIIFKIFVRFCHNIQRNAKRRLEDIYRMHLWLRAIPFESISIHFNQTASPRPNIDEMATNYKVNYTIKLLDKGVISPERAAQDLGYEKFHDEELFKKSLEKGTGELKLKRFDWDPAMLRYDHVSIPIANLADTKKTAQIAEETLKQKIEQYLKLVLPYFNELKTDAVDDALQYVKENIEAISQDSDLLLEHVQEYVNAHPVYSKIKDKKSWFRKESLKIIEKTLEYYKIEDNTVFGGEKPDVSIRFGEGDIKAVEFYEKLDGYFFSKFINNKDFGSSINQFIEGFLERGENLFGKWSSQVEKEFKRLFGEALDGDFKIQMERIVNTSITRLRSHAHIEQLFEANFNEGEIDATMDMSTCPICAALNGKRFKVAKAHNLIQSFISMDLEEATAFIINSNVSIEDVEAFDINELIGKGKGIIPLHIGCRCIMKGVLS